MSATNGLQKTPLHATHVALGAKMVEFAGFDMPVLYTNLIEEHNAVRNAIGMFDVSHMGEFIIQGDGAYDLLEWVTSNSVATLVPGKVQYTCLPNDKGGIVDDALLYMIGDNHYLLVVNASNIEKDLAWINSQNKWNCTVTNKSNDWALLAVQGPKAVIALQTITQVNLEAIPYYHFEMGSIGGIENVIISNTGYTGAGGFELYIPNNQAVAMWDAVMQAGKELGILPCGLGARDTLRLEKGFCLYGNDINDSTSPIEAGLGWITKFEKPFVNHQYHADIKLNKPTKKLVGFELTERGIARHGYKIEDQNGTEIGEVTSGTMSPTLGKSIGMGYVQTAYSKVDSAIFINIRGKQIAAKVCKIPFLA